MISLWIKIANILFYVYRWNQQYSIYQDYNIKTYRPQKIEYNIYVWRQIPCLPPTSLSLVSNTVLFQSS